MTTQIRDAVIENPVTGEKISFRWNDDSRLEFEYTIEPGGFAVGKVDHAHPALEERFDVRAGRLGVRIDGDEWTASPGTRFAIPPDTVHTVWNDGPDGMRATIEFRPGLAIDSFFETMFGLARAGKTNRMGLPNPLRLAVLADAYRDEFRFGLVPTAIQRAIAGTVAPIGRLVGYTADYHDD